MSRDDKLIALLPSKDSPYSFDNLSQAETAALEAALGDGFGNVGGPKSQAQPLPKEVRSGLLGHSYFVTGLSDYDPEEDSYEFWSAEEDSQEPYMRFPLGSVLRRLRLYFDNQWERFCAGQQSNLDSTERQWLFQELASIRLYQKPWYEFNAVKFLNWIELAQRDVHENRTIPLSLLAISSFSGQLGRLVEQYYWRFRFEEAAITGVGARCGASAGGKARAALHRSEHSVWQRMASRVWGRRPSLSKIAVAEAIRKQLGSARTAKHIARFISQP